MSSVLTQAGNWISFDSSPAGTPAETSVTVSDTSGITIVADFHGFWRNNVTINGTFYDDLDMPGATSIHDVGKPMLPVLSEFIEIPHGIDASIDLLTSSTDNTGGYHIRPAPPPQAPVAVGEPFTNTSSPISSLPTFEDPVYTDDTFCPGNTTSIEGGESANSLIMRGRRLLGLNFYPVQYNPVTNDTIVYSQIVVKVKYSIPAQIQPIPAQLRSDVFENIMIKLLLNYDSCSPQYRPPFGPAPGYTEGAEYLIITNDALKPQADRLAEWKELKGIPSAVVTIDSGTEKAMRNDVRTEIERVYTTWYPVPTYVVLFGDVDIIPTNYDMEHLAKIDPPGFFILPKRHYEPGYGWIASDLGYFDIEGQEYFPDMIYGRISVDTVDQARVIVDKILQYEKSPPTESAFYNSILSAGQFQDTRDIFGRHTGIEDADFPFISNLEIIRQYLEDNHGYTVHINYSSSGLNIMPLIFSKEIEESRIVSDSDLANYDWLWAYNDPIDWRCARENITKSINEGRFLVLYYGHGGSKNNNYRFDVNDDGSYDSNDRDGVEGWLTPFFNTTYEEDSSIYSYLSELTNEDNSSLVISIACSTGWFDGENDQQYMNNTDFDPINPYDEYENECFAEEITRLEGGGAVAAISASRVAYSIISGYMLDGIIQAFWPGFQGSQNQPIYEMGAALLFGKLYAARQWGSLHDEYEVARTTFEEYHLFGDPETQLWTDNPSPLDVRYPISIGTSDPQRFAVTVRNDTSGEPVNFAKVCLMQEGHIYEVGYTDSRGQVVFELAPAVTPAYINVTVTRHNFIPHFGAIVVHDSSAQVLLSHESAMDDEMIAINYLDYPDNSRLDVFVSGDFHERQILATNLTTSFSPYNWMLFPGFYTSTQFVNVLVVNRTVGISAEEQNPVAVNCFQVILTADGPDPYIYSQDDPSTWEDPTGEAVWDNPDIKIYRDGIEYPSLELGESNTIEVTVHNRGNDMDINGLVTLSYAPFGGGVTWHWIGESDMNVDHQQTETVTFTFTPELGQSVCLRVDLDHDDERSWNKINNIGYENTDVIEMSSPGTGTIHVGNPTNSSGYISIRLKQLGDYEDVWNALILGYSSQVLNAGGNLTIILFVDSLSFLDLQEWRLFEVEVFFRCRKVGGMILNATVVDGQLCRIIFWLVLGIVIVAIVYVVYKRRE